MESYTYTTIYICVCVSAFMYNAEGNPGRSVASNVTGPVNIPYLTENLSKTLPQKAQTHIFITIR